MLSLNCVKKSVIGAKNKRTHQRSEFLFRLWFHGILFELFCRHLHIAAVSGCLVTPEERLWNGSDVRMSYISGVNGSLGPDVFSGNDT